MVTSGLGSHAFPTNTTSGREAALPATDHYIGRVEVLVCQRFTCAMLFISLGLKLESMAELLEVRWVRIA